MAKKRRFKGVKKFQKQVKSFFKKRFKRKRRYVSKKQRLKNRRWAMVFIAAILGLWFIRLTNADENAPIIDDTSAETYSNEEFIDMIGGYAVENYSTSNVLPSIVIAQAVLESNYGQSELASEYYNLFGRKAASNEPSVPMPTLEYVDGQYVTVDEPFKVYDSWADSVADHGTLLSNGTSWNDAHYEEVISASTYQEAAQALQEAGYATDPEYAAALIDVIESNDLTNYDELVN